MTPPVLALHALFMDGASMGPLGAALGREVIAPGLPGHRRGPPWIGSRDYMEQAVEAARAALPEAPVDVFGHSIGGAVALHLAVAEPARVRSVVAFEPAFFAASSPGPLAAYLQTFQAITGALAAGREGTAAAKFNGLWGTGAEWEALPDALRKAIIRLLPIVPATAAHLNADASGLLPRLAECPVPVLILQQSEPHEIMRSICDGLRQRLPRAQVAKVTGEGRHMLPVTAPGAVAETVLGFWSELP
jgi:pimeloyl-ACP methyl ester carboxylesterase